jgi:hypothetical protein
MKSYHGPTPVTDDDITLAKKHLTDTLTLKKKELKLNNSKIADHKQAVAATDNPESKAYNRDHIEGHVKDNKAIKKVINERQASQKTIATLKPDRTYDDVRKAKVGIMTKKAGVDNG